MATTCEIIHACIWAYILASLAEIIRFISANFLAFFTLPYVPEVKDECNYVVIIQPIMILQAPLKQLQLRITNDNQADKRTMVLDPTNDGLFALQCLASPRVSYPIIRSLSNFLASCDVINTGTNSCIMCSTALASSWSCV